MGSIGDCRFVAMRCAGYDRVDLGTCAKLGITVARVPTYSPNSVAEHAVAMLMCLNRCDCLSRAFQTGSQSVSDRGGRSVSNVPTCAMSVSLLFCCACTTACGQLIACSACGAKNKNLHLANIRMWAAANLPCCVRCQTRKPAPGQHPHVGGRLHAVRPGGLRGAQQDHRRPGHGGPSARPPAVSFAVRSPCMRDLRAPGMLDDL